MYDYSCDGTLTKLKYLWQINGWILERNIENGKPQQIICCSRIYNLWEITEAQQVTFIQVKRYTMKNKETHNLISSSKKYLIKGNYRDIWPQVYNDAYTYFFPLKFLLGL